MLTELTIEGQSAALKLIKMEGYEGLSCLFHFKLIITSEKILDPQKIIGKKLTLAYNIPQDNNSTKPRYFHGIILQFIKWHNTDGLTYCAQLVPQLTLLKFRKNCRIFQNQSVIQIIEQILKENKVSKYDLTSKISSTYKALDYCVQYQESDFSFISRLLEHFGIFYLFEHAKDQHKLIFSDGKQSYSSNTIACKLTPANEVGIQSWQKRSQFFTGKWIINDHDYTNPNKKLLVDIDSKENLANNTSYSVYNYPGLYNDTMAGEKIAKVRLEEQETSALMVEATSTYPHLLVASKLSLDNPLFTEDKGKPYLITSISHYINLDVNRSSQVIYHNEFTCIPADKTFRPARVTVKPMAPGVQLATVVGEKGKEIYTNKYGEMKVQFVWHREGKNDEHSSCWMRSIQQWEGLLRIGTPVLIGFIDDDLDKPIILGPIHNAGLMPINSMPNEQTQSVLKRRYVKQADEKKYNEIRFQDKIDNQELSVYAAKNHLITVEQDSTQLVKKGNYVLTVDEKDSTQTVKKGNYVLQVKGDITIKADGSITLEAGKAIQIKAGTDMTLSAKKNIEKNAGANINITAKAKLTQNALEINNQAKTKLSHKALEIAHQADIRLTTKAAMQEVGADGILTLKGGIIKEN